MKGFSYLVEGYGVYRILWYIGNSKYISEVLQGTVEIAKEEIKELYNWPLSEVKKLHEWKKSY